LTLKELGSGIYVDSEKTGRVKKLDSVIFDCDGVLIDVSNSYDLAIKRTVDFVARTVASVGGAEVTSEMIDGFKRTGGFNDEVDVTYALVLAAVAAKKKAEEFPRVAREVAQNADSSGIRSVEKYLDSQGLDLAEIKAKLAYPSKRFESPLSSMFDEAFYGRDLYTRLYNRPPKYWDTQGLIENDVVLVTREILDQLRRKFGSRIAIVTGRGAISASHSLKSLFEEFDLKNSRFLEDEPREMAKPNPSTLVATIQGMQGTCSLFVGDSTEDLIMARKAEEAGVPTLFCGIYGTSKDPQGKRAFFEQKGADMVLESVSLLPKTLNLVGA